MPRRVPLVAALLIGAALAGAPPSAAKPASSLVFAAASTRDAVEAVLERYRSMTGSRAAASFASSGTLARQIENGAPANLFISANTRWMKYLDERRLLASDSRTVLFANRLALVSQKTFKGDIAIAKGFPLAQRLGDSRLAIGDPAHVPAGAYAKMALESLGVWPELQGKLALAKDVRGALALVEHGDARFGIVYTTDARISRLVRVAGIFPADSHAPIHYEIAVIRDNDSPAARQLRDYLLSPAARKIYSRFGFSVD